MPAGHNRVDLRFAALPSIKVVMLTVDEVPRTLLNIVRESPPAANDQPAAVSLSDQETRVLQALARGLGFRAIADELDLGLDLGRTYVRRIDTKLQTHTAAEAILNATKAGLL